MATIARPPEETKEDIISGDDESTEVHVSDKFFVQVAIVRVVPVARLPVN